MLCEHNKKTGATVGPVNIKTALLIKAWHYSQFKFVQLAWKNKLTVREKVEGVRMAERSKALRSGCSLLMKAWVRIPLLTLHLMFKVLFRYSESWETKFCTLNLGERYVQVWKESVENNLTSGDQSQVWNKENN